MKYNRLDIPFYILVMSVMCVFFAGAVSRAPLPAFPEPPAPITPPSQMDQSEYAGPLSDLSMREIRSLLNPLLRSDSEDQVVALMKGISPEKAKEIVQWIMTTDASRNFILNVLLGAAFYYKGNKQEQSQLFSLLDGYKELGQGAPIISVAARSLYPEVILDLLEWDGRDKEGLIYDALSYAVNTDDLDQLKIMRAQDHIVNAERSSELLWQAIDTDKSTEVVQFLIDQGADIEYVKDGKTLLISAIERVNKNNLEALIKTAQRNKKIVFNNFINRLVDNGVGTALQAVIKVEHDEKRSPEDKEKAVAIENMLRQYGATE